MLLLEYHIPLPITMADFQIAQAYTIIETIKKNHKNITMLENCPCDTRVFNVPKNRSVSHIRKTVRIYQLSENLECLSDLDSFKYKLRETSFNYDNWIKTNVIVTNDETKKIIGNFTVETICKLIHEQANNVFNLPDILLKKRKIIKIDQNNTNNQVTVYKLVVINNEQLDSIVELLHILFTKFYTKLVNLQTIWKNLSMSNIRESENKLLFQ